MQRKDTDRLSAAVGLLNLDIESMSAENEKNGTYSLTFDNGVSQMKNFPAKLYKLVSDNTIRDIIQWLPGGRAFIIHDKKRFASEILPRYFKQSQFTSFTRKLSRWNFIRVTRGPLMGAYYHELFQKDKPSLCRMMSCKNPRTAEDAAALEAVAAASATSKPMHSSASRHVTPSTENLLSLMAYNQERQALDARRIRLNRLLEMQRLEEAYETFGVSINPTSTIPLAQFAAQGSSGSLPFDETLQARNIVNAYDVDPGMRARMLGRARMVARARLAERARARLVSGLNQPMSQASSLRIAADRVRGERELLKRCFSVT